MARFIVWEWAMPTIRAGRPVLILIFIGPPLAGIATKMSLLPADSTEFFMPNQKPGALHPSWQAAIGAELDGRWEMHKRSGLLRSWFCVFRLPLSV